MSANVELIELKVEDNKIKILIESRLPISFEYFTDENTHQFGVSLSGADYYPDLIKYFQSIDIDSLSQCVDEIRIVPISVDSARFEVRLARDLVASVYDDTDNSPKNFRVIIQFEAVDKSNSPCIDDMTSDNQFQAEAGIDKLATAITLSDVESSKSGVVTEVEQAELNGRQDTSATVAQSSTRQRSMQNQLNYTAFVFYDVLAYVNKGGYSDDDWLKQESQSELREAILGAKGNYGGLQYQLAIRSAKNKEQNQIVSVYRASIGYLTEGMAWEFSAGMLLEPVGVESINELDKSSFLERSVTSYLTNDYNPGISMTYDNGDWLNWEIGVFSKRPVASEPSSEQSVASRVLLTSNLAGTNLSFGLSYRDATPVDNIYVIAARPEMNLILPLFSVTQAGVDTVTTTGASILAHSGSFDFTLEAFTSSLNLLSAATPTDVQEISSQSISASWVFTGEQREITNGKRQRLIPFAPVTLTKKGWGAWEASLRYSKISDDINQNLTTATLGAAWYLNEHVEIKASWIFTVQSATTIGTVDNDADLIGLRFQLQY
ncbi:MAG: porin [Thiohalomonadales bacterium]